MNPGILQKELHNYWRNGILAALIEYTKIPNLSPAFDPEWQRNGHMDAAAKLLTDAISLFSIKGLSSQLVQLPNRTPLIFIIVDAFNCDSGNVLLYGHFDKQPEFSGWDHGKGPWIPVLENDRLYGRGTGDDGYAIFSCLSALACLQQQGCPHPRCTILIEGCEESGSPDLPYYMEHLAAEIDKPDVVVCLDAECGNYDQLWLTTSLRGMLSGTLRVDVLTEGIHSGAAGGIVPSSFRVLRNLIERIENGTTGKFVPELLTEIPAWVHQQSRTVAQTLSSTIIERYPWARAYDLETIELSDLVTTNTWMPSLAVVGLDGAPSPDQAGNTLRPYTSAKLVFRLPPNARHSEIQDFVTAELERDPPPGVKANFAVDAAESGWFTPPVSPWLDRSLQEASLQFFGQEYQRMGTGGTIPFMKMLGDQYPECQFVTTGVLGPHSNAHGPNEFLDLPTAERVTACVAYILTQIGMGRHQVN